jgi:hypothetical protein
MALTERHQSLHDRASSSTVQPRDSTTAQQNEFVAEPTEPANEAPTSKRRRILVILGYQVTIVLVMILVLPALISEDCLMNDACNETENFASTIVDLIWYLLGGTVIVLGWR